MMPSTVFRLIEGRRQDVRACQAGGQLVRDGDSADFILMSDIRRGSAIHYRGRQVDYRSDRDATRQARRRLTMD